MLRMTDSDHVEHVVDHMVASSLLMTITANGVGIMMNTDLLSRVMGESARE